MSALLALALAAIACTVPNGERRTDDARPGAADAVAPADRTAAVARDAPSASASARAGSQASSGETSPKRPEGREGGPVPADLVKPFPPGLRGELLFQSDREGPTRLFVLDLAKAAIRRVGTAGEWLDEEPRWSNDGRRIAFSSTRGQKGNLDIFVMDADGSNVTRLTDHAAAEQGPVWAADGQSLFFTGERNGRGEIYRVWLADKRVERVTKGVDRAIMPAASPDGRHLVYAAQTIMSFQLHLLDLTTGASQQVTSGGGACRPAFAPDGKEVAFVRIDQEPSRLEAVREGGTRVLLQDKRLWSYYPDYSPDGRLIAFSVSPEHHRGEDWDLAIMDAQKPGEFLRLTTGPGNDRVPDWRPSVK